MRKNPIIRKRGMAARRAELLDDLEARTEVLLAEFGLAAEPAQHIAHALADHLAANWRGQTLSFPKDVAYALSKRERAILARHRLGAAVAELAQEFGLGERGMRKLLARARVRMTARRAELLDDLEARTEVLLAEFGLAAEPAQHIAHALADHLAANWGGQTLSFPKDVAYALSKRERAILARHRLGATVAELAQEFGLGERGMRKFLDRARVRGVYLDQVSFEF